jgi:AraC-like DNA-binding protein
VPEAIAFHGFPLAGIDPMSATTARAFPRHTHDQYGIGVVDAGGHASWSGRGQVEAGPGAFISVNPGEVHDGRAIGGRPRAWRILYFDPATLADLHTDIREGRPCSFTFAAPVFADRGLHRIFDAAFHHRAGQGETMACETAVLRLVARLSVHSTTRALKDEEPSTCIRRARKRIDADPAAPLTLIDLAQEAGLSRYQLIRSFARELGLTPHAYILQRRIALAQRLIRAGRDLAEVAAEAGFCDQSHLTRWFVRQLGVTPRRYAV